jgi:hypothetical protein
MSTTPAPGQQPALGLQPDERTVVQRGTWRYDGQIEAEVRICRSWVVPGVLVGSRRRRQARPYPPHPFGVSSAVMPSIEVASVPAPGLTGRIRGLTTARKVHHHRLQKAKRRRQRIEPGRRTLCLLQTVRHGEDLTRWHEQLTSGFEPVDNARLSSIPGAVNCTHGLGIDAFSRAIESKSGD